MPLFYHKVISKETKLAIWKIEEEEAFFNIKVPIPQNITHPQKRLQHLAGRFLLQHLFPDFPYESIVVANNNKPYLPNEAYHFSISHCKEYAAAIVSTQQRVGIDVELIEARVLKVIRKFLNQKERLNFNLEMLRHNNDIALEQQKTATLLWSIKESLFKWYAVGNVDFKTMLQINVGKISNQGQLYAAIHAPNKIYELQTDYHFFNQLCLSFVVH